MNDGEKIRAVLRHHPAVAVAVLFGSLARGAARPDSDVDLAVAAARPLTRDEVTALTSDLALATGRAVDLVDLQAAGIAILHQSLTRGRLLYCSDRRLYAGLIRRMLFDEADVLRYRRRILAARRQAWTGV